MPENVKVQGNSRTLKFKERQRVARTGSINAFFILWLSQGPLADNGVFDTS